MQQLHRASQEMKPLVIFFLIFASFLVCKFMGKVLLCCFFISGDKSGKSPVVGSPRLLVY